MHNDFSLRRLERYLSIGWNSGALPVVVLIKSDLCDDTERRLYETTAVSAGADVLVTSAMHADGYAQIIRYIRAPRTVALIGSSGVGKSTLMNRLLGEAKQDVNGLRNDDKGRHTTTRRELIILENGGMVIDTPGMRELGLEGADVAKAFADIDELAAGCRFCDCTHTGEPGCMVQSAILEGALSPERLASYCKLKKEMKYGGLGFKQIGAVKANEMFQSVGGMKNA